MAKHKKKELAEEISAHILGPNPVIGLNRKSIVNSLKTLALKTISNPAKTINHQVNLAAELLKVVQGRSELEAPSKDKRFQDTAWKENPFYKMSMQTYLAIAKELNEWVEDLNMGQLDEDRSKFLVALLTEAVAPSNWITNPTALKRVLETGGKSWVKGAKNLIDDIRHNKGYPSQQNRNAFTIGKDIACTKGSVIYKNELLELIQYQPQTEKVYARPLFMIPPQVNKYYVFDMAPERSLIEYLLRQGIQVFIISWRNPTAKERDWDMGTYAKGAEECTEIIKKVCKVKDMNVWGACSGGMSLAATLGYLEAKGNKCVHSASLLIAVLDVKNITETSIGLFADDDAIEISRQRTRRKGILSGNEIATGFCWMRPNDLIWTFWVNNYLMGNHPPEFDILFWSEDSTNLPAGLHSHFMDIVQYNILTKKGALKIDGYPVDLSKVKNEMYFVAGITDHISPWKQCYHSVNLFGGENPTFVLTNRGHIQTIVNPGDHPRVAFYTNEKEGYLPNEPDQWLANAVEQKGTWWSHYAKWLQKRSGRQKKPPLQLGNKQYQPLYEAPGKYLLD